MESAVDEQLNKQAGELLDTINTMAKDYLPMLHRFHERATKQVAQAIIVAPPELKEMAKEAIEGSPEMRGVLEKLPVAAKDLITRQTLATERAIAEEKDNPSEELKALHQSIKSSTQALLPAAVRIRELADKHLSEMVVMMPELENLVLSIQNSPEVKDLLKDLPEGQKVFKSLANAKSGKDLLDSLPSEVKELIPEDVKTHVEFLSNAKNAKDLLDSLPPEIKELIPEEVQTRLDSVANAKDVKELLDSLPPEVKEFIPEDMQTRAESLAATASEVKSSISEVKSSISEVKSSISEVVHSMEDVITEFPDGATELLSTEIADAGSTSESAMTAIAQPAVDERDLEAKDRDVPANATREEINQTDRIHAEGDRPILLS